MPKLIPAKNSIKERFGRLLVLGIAGKQGSHTMMACRCDCGRYTAASLSNLRQRCMTSCGCRKNELTAQRNRDNATHRLTSSPTWITWCGMRQRCENPNHDAYKSYGGRGIIIDASWKTFERFLEDMGERPRGRTLDRIDSNGPYSKDNCRWATKLEQGRNRRDNQRVQFEGAMLTTSEIIEKTKFTGSHGLLFARLFKLGWPVSRALNLNRTPGDMLDVNWEGKV